MDNTPHGRMVRLERELLELVEDMGESIHAPLYETVIPRLLDAHADVSKALKAFEGGDAAPRK